jgi:hypothetical protein
MTGLQFPDYSLRTRDTLKGAQIWCGSRKRWVSLSPEEWVRQHMIAYLTRELGYPESLISAEKELVVNGLKKRFDILCHDFRGFPLLLIECKSPDVLVTPEVFDQAARYNLALGAPFLCCSNGLNHFFCRVNSDATFIWYQSIPGFGDIC